ncbi:MAG: AraC family transcriptional regulator [Gammaproteobacteria bacterium]|nr:AraC family transcriptional regulator [Gammaproteobacteria bacterium]MBI5617618.1 AraC family transcriptional regulator [Gammaproteobacteria bacterium]
MDVSDCISTLIDRIGLRAGTFYAGRLCGTHAFHEDEGVGHLHVVRHRSLTVTHPDLAPLHIEKPTLLFYPRPLQHRLEVPEWAAADIVCASVRYDVGMENAMTRSFPAVLAVPIDAAPALESTLTLLFAEAAVNRVGRQVMLDRLCDVLLLQIVRYAVEHELVVGGTLGGLAHPRLGGLVAEILDAPERSWTLETMAHRAHLSRSAFARLFKAVLGVAPIDFLTKLRIANAQQLLRKGRPLAVVASAVGYGSQPALSRAFIREVGAAPSEWLRAIEGQAAS